LFVSVILTPPFSLLLPFRHLRCRRSRFFFPTSLVSNYLLFYYLVYSLSTYFLRRFPLLFSFIGLITLFVFSTLQFCYVYLPLVTLFFPFIYFFTLWLPFFLFICSLFSFSFISFWLFYLYCLSHFFAVF